MKQLICLLFLIANLSIIEQANGQVPQKFNYQGIARDAKGNPIGNQLLSLKLSILPSADAIVPEYEETHTVNTNEFGLYSLQIGNGSSITNEIKNVKWETGNKYIRVAIDPKGGTNYLVAGTSQLLSVPYAIYAERAGSAKEAIDTQGDSRTGAVSSNAAHVAGDANYLAKFTGLNTIGKSAVYDNGASIGIGSASPLARIHVNGTTGTSTEIRLQHAAATGSSRFAFFADNGTTFSTTGDYTVMNKYTAGTTGTLTSGFPLRSLYAFSNSKGGLFFTTASNIGFGQYTSATNTYSTRLFIDSATGNVGIGTVTPASKLEVVGQVKITGGTPGLGKVLTSDASGLATWETPTGGIPGPQGPIGLTGPAGSANISGTINNIIKFNGTTSGSNSIITDDGSNVGIGTSIPSAKLEVAGQVKITGGSPGDGKVLTSDATGLSSWQNIPVQTGNIIGFVRLQDVFGNSVYTNLSGTVVNIYGSSFSSSTTTNADGRYEFTGISSGTYSITATKAGYGSDNIDRVSFVGGTIPTLVSSISISQIPTFTVTSLTAAQSGTSIVVSGSINPATANKSTIGIFIGSSASVSSNTANYIAFKEISTAVSSNTFAFTLTAQVLASIGIPTGSTIYFKAYPINTNNGTSSGYTDNVNGRRIFTAIGTTGVGANVIVP